MHRSKRRRVDSVASTPTKPFRSPLHANANESGLSSAKKLDNPDSQNRSMIDDTPSNLAPTPTSTPSVSTRSSSVHEQCTGSNRSPAKTSPLTYQPLNRNEDYNYTSYTQLQKRYSALKLELKQLTTALDTTNQALKVLGSNTDNELETLIAKWQTITREAAEDLFATAKDQVDNMGGVGVWRDRYMRPRRQIDAYGSSLTSWSADGASSYDNQQIDYDNLTEDQMEQLDFARKEAAREAERYGGFNTQQGEDVKVSTDNDDDDDDDDNDSFTIDMMLRQLNIDLDVVGYDRQNQCWLE